MKLYAFELGRKKELCFAELIAVLGEKNLVERSRSIAIFKAKTDDPQSLQNRLGGTIKIMEIFKDVAIPKLEKSIQNLLEESFKNHSGKIPFAISILSFKDHKSINIKKLLNFSKKILKSLGLNSRFVNKGPISPKPSTIYKAKVIEKGIDLCIINGRDKIYLGKTVSIQDIAAYSKRDYEKPGRDPRAGMLPPKLAQILINLASPETKTIYDPFCGTGTILTEALLMGKTAVGSDIDPRMMEYSLKNLKWTTENFQTKESYRIFEKDARFLTKSDLPEKIDAIVTEGYLGKPLTKAPTPEQQEAIFRELSNLHLNWLRTVGEITACPVVMCVTAFKKGPKLEHLPRFEELAKEAGYKVVDTFTYDRPDQIVVRDIKILAKS